MSRQLFQALAARIAILFIAAIAFGGAGVAESLQPEGKTWYVAPRTTKVQEMKCFDPTQDMQRVQCSWLSPEAEAIVR